MLVNRMTLNAKAGRASELVGLIKSIPDSGLPSPPRAWRVYWPNISPYDAVIVEVEFESLAEHQAYWDEWFAAPGVATFMEKWYELADRGGTDEVWNVEVLP